MSRRIRDYFLKHLIYLYLILTHYWSLYIKKLIFLQAKDLGKVAVKSRKRNFILDCQTLRNVGVKLKKEVIIRNKYTSES